MEASQKPESEPRVVKFREHPLLGGIDRAGHLPITITDVSDFRVRRSCRVAPVIATDEHQILTNTFCLLFSHSYPRGGRN